MSDHKGFCFTCGQSCLYVKEGLKWKVYEMYAGAVSEAQHDCPGYYVGPRPVAHEGSNEPL